VVINDLLQKKIHIYNACLVLTRIVCFKIKKKWLCRRQTLKTNNNAFDDLIYLNKFVVDKESQNQVRFHSIQIFCDDSTDGVVPQKKTSLAPLRMQVLLKKFSSDNVVQGCDNTHSHILAPMQKNAETSNAVHSRPSQEALSVIRSRTPNQYFSSNNILPDEVIPTTMDIPEFLMHLNLHMQMNLDYVFLGKVDDLVQFFASLESFLEHTFQNKEVEVKIDIIRLMIRMTNATFFVEKLLLLHKMKIDFLEQWQTFSLFTQVLIHEIKKCKIQTTPFSEDDLSSVDSLDQNDQFTRARDLSPI